jgi:hypothetical protein
MANRSAKKFAGVLAAIAACAFSSGACSNADEDRPACEAEKIESLKELIVVEDAVLEDSRSRNATDGPWSFRFAMENLAPIGADPAVFVRQWLGEWITRTEFNGVRLDVLGEERGASMTRLVLCPWLKQSEANACNEDCSSCAQETLDLGKAPFKLIAIANRLDLHNELGEGVAPNGEGRLVFALTSGPADDPASTPLAMTVIFEYTLARTKTRGEWARAWHELGKFSSFDEPYRAALEGVTNQFVLRDSNPEGAFGSSLGQIRTNDSALNWIWQLRQFALGGDGTLQLQPLRNTPPERLNGSETLLSYVRANAAEIRSGKYTMPPSMLAGSADALRYSWKLPSIEPLDARAFRLGTCNGCHSEFSVTDTAFHVSPFRKGPDRLSRFLYDPDGGGQDEMTKRSNGMREALCGR